MISTTIHGMVLDRICFAQFASLESGTNRQRGLVFGCIGLRLACPRLERSRNCKMKPEKWARFSPQSDSASHKRRNGHLATFLEYNLPIDHRKVKMKVRILGQIASLPR